MKNRLRFNFEGDFPDELDSDVEAVWWDEQGRVEGIILAEKQERVQSLLPGAIFTLLEERDWLKEDEQRLPPLEVGPFFIHGPHYEGEREGWVIESAHAFGSGHHPTTHRCLDTLLKLSDKVKVTKALDLGCGSGILAMGISDLWDAEVIASDCEKESVDAACRNFQRNGFPEIKVYESFGLDHPDIQREAPYDLIVANIHSGPLCLMSSDIISALSPSGTLLLSGLLMEQEEEVKNAFVPLIPIASFYNDRWTTLLFQGKES